MLSTKPGALARLLRWLGVLNAQVGSLLLGRCIGPACATDHEAHSRHASRPTPSPFPAQEVRQALSMQHSNGTPAFMLWDMLPQSARLSEGGVSSNVLMPLHEAAASVEGAWPGLREPIRIAYDPLHQVSCKAVCWCRCARRRRSEVRDPGRMSLPVWRPSV